MLMSWEDARSYCQENVPYNIGDLASIPDAGTNNLLQTLIQDAYIWIGGYRDSDGSWVWSDGTPWAYSSFQDGQPNNLGSVQNHLALNLNSLGKWNDDFEEEEKGFVCYYKGKQVQINYFNML